MGTHVNTWDHSWRIVQKVGHSALGLCLDSFHILSRASDPAGIADVPGEKLFFLQLADAPHLTMCCSGAATTGCSPAKGLRSACLPRLRPRRRIHRAALARSVQ
ncbi:sugar phosphate isomerase/epimerase family protein [Nocardia sp. NPDC052278]|uniref:sugar phosphate isomerase/epimerase family protein n=1 Tax=unclassified Nocardia TaxID=2637762 RepID=UPI0036840D1D